MGGIAAPILTVIPAFYPRHSRESGNLQWSGRRWDTRSRGRARAALVAHCSLFSLKTAKARATPDTHRSLFSLKTAKARAAPDTRSSLLSLLSENRKAIFQRISRRILL